METFTGIEYRLLPSALGGTVLSRKPLNYLADAIADFIAVAILAGYSYPPLAGQGTSAFMPAERSLNMANVGAL